MGKKIPLNISKISSAAVAFTHSFGKCLESIYNVQDIVKRSLLFPAVRPGYFSVRSARTSFDLTIIRRPTNKTNPNES